ncbi:MAG: hypothetical protein K0S00_4476 [Xanthobacteraceae bacterium]|jgi:hypothetical protein|nr:hypothetical protein [Xanthobacteraceae bacterium]
MHNLKQLGSRLELNTADNPEQGLGRQPWKRSHELDVIMRYGTPTTIFGDDGIEFIRTRSLLASLPS